MPRDLSAMTRTLSGILGPRARITGIRQMSDGFSNETYAVDGADLILRMPSTEAFPLLAPFGVHDVMGQLAIMTEWGGRPGAPPVPRAVYGEADPAVLGAPFFVMERVACQSWGDWGVPDWLMAGDDAFRGAVAEQFVDCYAGLHRLQPLAAFGAPLSLLGELERWFAPIANTDFPLLHEAFAILRATAPIEAKPAPCHGDAKPANILWRDGRIVAVLDYEMGFNGDPRWDLGALLQVLKNAPLPGSPALDSIGFWDRERMIGEWAQRTGRSPDAMVWFEGATRARYAAILAYGAALCESGTTSDIRLAQVRPVAERIGGAALELARTYAGMLS